jgi:PPIC-type PPIASE domain
MLVSLASCSSATPPAATIDGSAFTDAQLAHEVNVFSFLAGLSKQPCGTPDAGESPDSACARFALSNVIEEHFAGKYAAAHNISISDTQIQATLSQLDSQVGAAQVTEELKTFHLTRADLTDLARRVLLFTAVQRAVTVEKLTDATIHQLYQQNILNYITVQVDHILVKTRAEAEQVYKQVTAPGATTQDFLNLAKKVSIDPSAKQNSGSLGSAVASQYVAPFAQAAAALKPGQISKPVHTQFGWHVILLVSKQVKSFAQARSDVIDSRSIVVFNAWMRDQITADGVRVNPKYGRYDLASLEVARISSTATGSESATPVASPVSPTASP